RRLPPHLQFGHRHDPGGGETEPCARQEAAGRPRPALLRNRSRDSSEARLEDAGGLPMKKRLGILLSGRGSNFEAIAASIEAGRIDAEIAVVVSNRPDARGLDT